MHPQNKKKPTEESNYMEIIGFPDVEDWTEDELKKLSFSDLKELARKQKYPRRMINESQVINDLLQHARTF